MKFTEETVSPEPAGPKSVYAWLQLCADEYPAHAPQRKAIINTVDWARWHGVPVPSTGQIPSSGRALVSEYLYIRRHGRPSGQWDVPASAYPIV